MANKKRKLLVNPEWYLKSDKIATHRKENEDYETFSLRHCFQRRIQDKSDLIQALDLLYSIKIDIEMGDLKESNLYNRINLFLTEFEIKK